MSSSAIADRTARGLQTRLAGVADLEAVVALREHGADRAYGERARSEGVHDQVIESLASPELALRDLSAATVWLAFVEDTPVGTAALRFSGAEAELCACYCLRGHGAGAALTDVRLRAAVAAGAETAWLEVNDFNKPAHEHARRHGFTVVGARRGTKLLRNTTVVRYERQLV